MSFFAHHGYYTHEQTRGGNYLVDVSLQTDIDRAAIGDELQDTINYEIIFTICQDIMGQPAKLIETVAYRIAHEVKRQFPKVKNIEVVVHKLLPELGGPVESAQIFYTIP